MCFTELLGTYLVHFPIWDWNLCYCMKRSWWAQLKYLKRWGTDSSSLTPLLTSSISYNVLFYLEDKSHFGLDLAHIICLIFFCIHLNIKRVLLCSLSYLLANIYWTLTLSSAVLTAWHTYAHLILATTYDVGRHYYAHFISEETEAHGFTRLTCQTDMMPELTLTIPYAPQFFLQQNKPYKFNVLSNLIPFKMAF